MTPSDLLTHLLMLDVAVAADGDQLRLNAPKGVVTAELREALAAHKPALLALLRGRDSAPRAEPAPLSFAQQRMWMLDRMIGVSSAYNIPGALRLEGALDVEALAEAFGAILARHEVLRTTFEVRDGEAVQVVQPARPFELPLDDLSGLPDGERAARLAAIATAAAAEPFDLERGPLFRARLVREAPQVHTLLAATHHIASDGWSMGIFVRELGECYAARLERREPRLVPLAMQYADYARWERRHLAGERLASEVDWWRAKLTPPVATLDLPMARPRPPVQTQNGDELARAVPQPLAAGLRAFAESRQATLFMVLLAGFEALLFRHTGQADVVVGTPIANRTRLAVEGLIGFFANTLVLRTDLSGDPSFGELVERVKATVLDADSHQEIPFDKLVEELRPSRDASRNPFFQVMFAVQHAGEVRIELPGLRATVPQRASAGTARFDLTATFRDSGSALDLVVEYNTDLFAREAMEALVARFEVLLAAALADPARPISRLALLPAEERDSVLARWNATGVAREATTFPRLFEARARASAARVAIAFEGASLTYHELDARANRLAQALRSAGVGRGDRVGVCLERGLDLAVALLGVQKSGGAYVPLDPGFPAERLAYMLADSGARVLLTAQGAADAIERPDGVQVMDLALDAARLAAFPQAAPEGGAQPGDPAYVIYTSGSTGRPKGVAVPHGALANFLQSMQREPGLQEDDVLAAVTTLSFDIAGLELYGPWLVGARVAMLPREVAADGPDLAKALDECGATVLQATPATWRLLLEAGWKGRAGLRAFCGGEALPREVAEALLPRVAELWNLYGPTETTVWSTVERVRPGAAITIGRPIDNTQVYVVDAAGEPRPVGVPGEIWIAGEGVALGYHERPELTAERFVPDPFAGVPGARAYRTGDLGRWRADGRLEHLGRMDHQVKVRGFRIELGEIEAELAAHEAVAQCLVMAREAGPGDPRLVAYVVYRAGEEPTVSEVRRFLKRRLPDYMVPSIVVALDAMPLTPNGKADRAALPDPFAAIAAADTAHEPPAAGLETVLAEVWRELLKVERVGAHDNFFELGGHSLLSLRVANAVQQRTGWRMDPRALFFQSLRQVAASHPGGAGA